VSSKVQTKLDITVLKYPLFLSRVGFQVLRLIVCIREVF